MPTQLGSTRPARAAMRYRLGALPVTDTGMRGLLKWMRQEYPPAIYQKIAQGIQQHLPQAFSGYMLGGWRNLGKLAGLADTTGTATVDTADAANSTPISPSWVDTISQLVGLSTATYLDVQQQKNQAAVLNTQLTAAQNGRAPYTLSLAQNGVTFSSGQTTLMSGLLLVGAGFLAYKFLRRRR